MDDTGMWALENFHDSAVCNAVSTYNAYPHGHAKKLTSRRVAVYLCDTSELIVYLNSWCPT